jgi:hypothetical protein
VRRSALLGVVGTTWVLTLAELFGCAASGQPRLALSSGFYGTWQNANPALENWMIISSERTVPYRIAEGGTCSTYRAEILGPTELRLETPRYTCVVLRIFS